ncbi:MAG: MFS transporter [Sphaerochaetaceae bacterium]|nr:MFS transporter [Sphaerochaetaceae bacterium]
MEKKISTLSKVMLCSADGFTLSLYSLMTSGMLTYYYTKYLGLTEGRASIVWAFFAAWNFFTPTLFGYISDRVKSKLGRRRPFIRYGCFFTAGFFCLSWQDLGLGSGQSALMAQMLGCLFLFDLCHVAVSSSIYIMPYEMTLDNNERASIFTLRIVSNALAMAIPLALVPTIKPQVGQSALVFRIVMDALGLLALAVIHLSTYFYKEEEYEKKADGMGFFKGLVACFKNISFDIYMICNLSVVFIQTILTQGVLYYFDEFSTPMILVYASLAAGIVIGIVLFSKIAASLGIRRRMLGMFAIMFSGTLTVWLGGALPALCAIGFLLAGIGFAGAMLMVPLLIGDAIDYDESVTGLRREGMYFGVNNVTSKPAVSLANSAFLLIIQAFGYDQALGKGLQSVQAKSGILFAWMGTSALAVIIPAISILFYTLDGPAWTRTKAELQRKHDQGAIAH